MKIDPTTLSSLIMVGTAIAGAFVAGLWLSLIFWTYRDIKSRTKDPLLRILATLITLVFFLPGIIIYLILRPRRTIEDEYQRTLEDETLLQTIEDRAVCPGCSRQIDEEWTVCPSCHTLLKTRCHSCNHLLELVWDICPYCETPTPVLTFEENTAEELPENI